MRSIFPDSEIARAYSSASTKTTCMINGCLAPHFKSILVEAMKVGAYLIAVDGSNDTGIDKIKFVFMSPVVEESLPVCALQVA